MQPICETNEKIKKEFVSAPSWRVNRFQVAKGIVTVRGGGYIRGVCMSPTGSVRMSLTPMAASFDLQYPAPLDRDNWSEQIPLVLHDGGELSPSNNPNDHIWGLMQSFLILKNQSEKTRYTAGEVWRTQFILQALDVFQPPACQLYIAGTEYSFIKQDTLPGVNNFDSCRLTSLGNNQYQVDGEVRIPANARPDRYYVPVILLGDDRNQRVAIASIPQMIQVDNPGAPASPVIKEIRIPGLPPTNRMGDIDLTNSYIVNDNQIFTVEFDVVGPQKVYDLWLEMDLWYPRPIEAGVLNLAGSSQSFAGILTNTQITSIPNGSRVTLTFRMPVYIRNIPVAALKFKKFLMRTSDFSWVEIEITGLKNYLVVNSRVH